MQALFSREGCVWRTQARLIFRMQVVQDPDSSAADLATVISANPGLSARFLRVVNSAADEFRIAAGFLSGVEHPAPLRRTRRRFLPKSRDRAAK